jgi:chromosome segregation ATPase
MKTKWSRKNLFRSQNFWIIVLVVAISKIAFHSQLDEWIGVAPPSVAIERLAIATTMTRKAEQIFYRQTPTIEPKQTFLKVCQTKEKLNDTLIMFGCYVTNGESSKIAIQSVTDDRFQGVMEVTAAHEMLHAAYSRLSLSDRDKLTPQLKQAALRIKNDRLSRVLKEYKQKDIALYVNELHSYLGTEIGYLGDVELEQYYQRYFRDRQQVVKLADRSQESVRKLDEKSQQLKPEIETLEASLAQTKKTIKDRELELRSQQRNLDALKLDLMRFKEQAEESYRQGNGSPEKVFQFEQKKSDYNQKVQEFNDLVRQQKERVAGFQKQFDIYKQKVNDYNAIAREEKALFTDLKATPPDKPEAPASDDSHLTN